MTSIEHPGRAKMAQQTHQDEVNSVDPESLLAGAQEAYQTINALTEQVAQGSQEMAPALEQAEVELQSILELVDANENIDNQEFQAAMLGQPSPAEAQAAQQQEVLAQSPGLGGGAPEAPTQAPDIYAPNPVLAQAKQGLGAVPR